MPVFAGHAFLRFFRQVYVFGERVEEMWGGIKACLKKEDILT